MVDKLLRLIRVLTTLPNTDEAIQRFLQELADHYRADRAYIIEYDLECRTLSNTYEWCAPGVSSEMDMLQGLIFPSLTNGTSALKNRAISIFPLATSSWIRIPATINCWKCRISPA